MPVRIAGGGLSPRTAFGALLHGATILGYIEDLSVQSSAFQGSFICDIINFTVALKVRS